MSKEFHVFTHRESQYEQAFVFEVERHETEQMIEFKDLLMVLVTQHGELRTRVKFDDMVQSIIHTNGGNVDDSGMGVIVDMFKDLIPQEKQTEIYTDLDEKKIKNIDPNELIKASEYAIIMEATKANNDKPEEPTQ
jgi:hypothetical protein